MWRTVYVSLSCVMETKLDSTDKKSLQKDKWWNNHSNEASSNTKSFSPFADPDKNGQLAMIKTEAIENALKAQSGWSGGAQDKYG